MEFLHINPSTKNSHIFDKMVNDGKNVFVLIYMEGCGPCNQTRPEWTKIKNILGQPQQKIKYPGVVVADVDQSECSNIKHISGLSGFPTMRYISSKGNVVENYENDRSIDGFIKWIDSKQGSFVDMTPRSSFSRSSMGRTRTAQGRHRRRRHPRRSSRRSLRRRSLKNAGWKWKPKKHSKRNK